MINNLCVKGLIPFRSTKSNPAFSSDFVNLENPFEGGAGTRINKQVNRMNVVFLNRRRQKRQLNHLDIMYPVYFLAIKGYYQTVYYINTISV